MLYVEMKMYDFAGMFCLSVSFLTEAKVSETLPVSRVFQLSSG